MGKMTFPGRGTDGVVLAVDGGGSKTDVLALSLQGELVSHRRGPGSNPQNLGIYGSLEVIRGLVREVMASAEGRPLIRTHIYLAGMDLPAEVQEYAAAVGREDWAQASAGFPAVVDNDLFALLRAGTDEPDAAAVVCGTGINAIGVRGDGATARFPSLGMISGDRGGGAWLGAQALWHAARSEDGRGPKSLLQELVPRTYGFTCVFEVFEAIHFKRIPDGSTAQLAPVLFAASAQGDPVAQAEVDRQAEEIAVMASTVLHRLDLQDAEVPVVLGGSILASHDERLMAGVTAGLAGLVPKARIELVTAPPILGAGLLALEAAGAGRDDVKEAGLRLRAALTLPSGPH